MTRQDGIERLLMLLGVHGADARRWPAGEASALEPLLAGDPEARRLLAEARALDRLLASSVMPEPDEAAARRVVAGALAGIRREADVSRASDVNRETAGAMVVDLAARRDQRGRADGGVEGVRRLAAKSREFQGPRRAWQAAALLAASLVAGFAVGATGLSERAFEPITVVVAGSALDMEDDFFGLFGEVGQNEDLI